MAKQKRTARQRYNDECYNAYINFNRVRNLSQLIPNCPFDIDIKLPEPPKNYKSIANYGLKKEQRKFPYYDLNKLRKMPSEYAAEFLEKEVERRYKGFWFYNGDNLEYITGKHYMFLQYWTVEATKKTDSGASVKLPSQPYFIDMQRDWHYAWYHVERDVNCFGMIFTGRRRTAKSEMALSEGYWHTTESKSRKFYMQSKTDNDGLALMKRLVTAWQNMPYFLKPIDKGSSDVKRILEFREPTKRSSKTNQSKREYMDVLDSEIGCAPSTDTALDGRFVSRILNDEVFKTPMHIADIKNRWEINKKCLIDGSDIVGKAILTSTVEEVSGDGLEHMIDLINESDLKSRNENTGRTTSGLYNLFFPAYYGLSGNYKGKPLVDEWGYSDMELAREYLEAERSGLKGASLINEKRRNPFTLDEAFYLDTNLEIFNQECLRSADKYNVLNGVYDVQVRKGNFYWVDGMRWGRVAWKDSESGRWLRFIDSPEENRNKYRIYGGQKEPTGRMFFSGCDPVDHGKVRDGKGSTAVSHVICLSSPHIGVKKPTMACQYAYRHSDPNLFYEDMIMQNVYYNSMFLAENQKRGVISYFKDKGFERYCMYDPTETDLKRKFRGDRGMPTTGRETRDFLIRNAQSYINENVGYIEETGEYGMLPFKETIKDLLTFNPAKWTPHDYAVSFMITIAATLGQQSYTQQTQDYLSLLPNRPRRS